MDVEDEEEDDNVEEDDLMRWMSRMGRKMISTLCASLRSRNAHGQEPFCLEIDRKNAGRRFRGHRSVRACAVEMHFVWKFTGKMPDAPENTSIKHRALTVSVRTPSVWPHCLGNCVWVGKICNS